MATTNPSAIPEVIADAAVVDRRRDRPAPTVVPAYDQHGGLGPSR